MQVAVSHRTNQLFKTPHTNQANLCLLQWFQYLRCWGTFF